VGHLSDSNDDSPYYQGSIGSTELNTHASSSSLRMSPHDGRDIISRHHHFLFQILPPLRISPAILPASDFLKQTQFDEGWVRDSQNLP